MSVGGFHNDDKYLHSQFRDPLLAEREKTHGSFAQNAIVSQHIKHIYHSMGKYPAENAAHAEALDMIALKLSRILSGQANFRDHWRDLSGYALLAMEACPDDKN